MKKGFDSYLYIENQSSAINKRLRKFKKLYLEIGGKLIYDNHASRVLPGFDKKSKLKILKKLGPLDIFYCINAKDLASKRTLSLKMRSFDSQARKDIKDIEKNGLKVSRIIITKFKGERKALAFKEKMQKKGYLVTIHNFIDEYFKNMKETLDGYEKNSYIQTSNNLIIITGPGGNSGKMGLALSQIYHEKKKRRKTGFAKYETFPIHNLEPNNPINLAYEAATADLQDKNLVDPFHKKEYKINSTNYNRDINNFKILKRILSNITGEIHPFGYKSPTDMGINMAKSAVTNEEICKEAAIKEIKNRYKRYLYEHKKGRESVATIKRMNEILEKIR